MAEKHIISAFDEDIEKIQSTLMKMGGLVEKRAKLYQKVQHRS